MMKIKFLKSNYMTSTYFCFSLLIMPNCEDSKAVTETEDTLKGIAMNQQNLEKPKFLFKILSEKGWEESKEKNAVVLSAMDTAFIHLSKEDQLDRIMDKYWSEVDRLIVLKLDTNKLNGNIVYEANPGGTSKYYHLYNGNIPLDSIVEVKVINR